MVSTNFDKGLMKEKSIGEKNEDFISQQQTMKTKQRTTANLSSVLRKKINKDKI
jgi:hypothetical protein